MLHKRILSLVLALLLAVSAPLGAAMAEEEEEYVPSAAEIALEGRPPKDSILHVTVGNTTKVSGNFFTRQFGNNTSDIDVRQMIHGYDLVVWNDQAEFITDPQVVEDCTKTTANGDTVYTVTLAEDLTYNDGVTPVTAADYVFSLLMLASDEFAALGAETGAYSHIVGWDEYTAGETDYFAGVRLLGKYKFSVTVKKVYEPYFYELSYLSVLPYPISVLAPGCTVRDNPKGAYICNEDETIPEPVYTTQLLYETIFTPETGFYSAPMLTTGPYNLVSYDQENGIVEFAINEFYKGNYEGVVPYIDEITLVPVLPETMMDQLMDGEVDVLNKCVDGDVILGMIADTPENINVYNYARLGYGFLTFSCEKGPQQFKAVRQAVDYCFDGDYFVRVFLRGLGIQVHGYYGLGQWMTMAAFGTLKMYKDDESDKEEWDALTLDNLNPYEYDPDAAKALLIKDGWVLNENGEVFDEKNDSVRYKKLEDGTLMPLSFRFARCIDNYAAGLVVEMLEEAFPLIGAELVVIDVPFVELLADHYREGDERLYDMCFMATNFVSTFDPYMTLVEDEEFEGSMNTTGLFDEELIKLSWDMHATEPMDFLTYETKWITFQERYNEVLPSLPIYSNVYFDFTNDWLQNYNIAAETNWPIAMLYAFWAEPEVEDEEIEEDEDFEFDDDFEILDDDFVQFHD